MQLLNLLISPCWCLSLLLVCVQVAGDWIFFKDAGGRSVNEYGDASKVTCG